MLKEYAKAQRRTLSNAVDFLLYERLRWLKFDEERRRKWGSRHDWGRGIAQSLVKENPKINKSQLGWGLVRRGVPYKIARELADEFF